MTNIMHARYRGTCACGASFARGTVICYDRAARRVTACEKCNGTAPATKANAGPDRFDMAYEDACAAACGLDGFGRG